jgi:PAS domain S-box-containing protein
MSLDSSIRNNHKTPISALEKEVSALEGKTQTSVQPEFKHSHFSREELEGRERELTSLMENASIGLHWVGPDGTIQWANKADFEFLGYSADEYIGRNIIEFYADRRVIDDILGRLSRGERICDYEARLKCKDGSIKTVLIDSSVLWDGDRFLHTQCFTRDITTQKGIEKRLSIQYAVSTILGDGDSISEATLKVLERIGTDFDWSTGALWILENRQNRLKAVSFWQAANVNVPNFRKVTEGMTFAAGVGLPGRVWASQSPDWVTNVATDPNFPRAAAASQDGLISGFAFPLKIDEHVVGLIELFARNVRTADPPFLELMNALSKQIAQFIQRKRIEEQTAQLATIVEQSDDAIISKDLNGIMKSWNKGAERLFGYTAEEAVGKPVTILIPEERLSEEPAILQRIRSGEHIDHYETVRRRKDGTLLDISLTISPIRDSAGNVIAASKVARDITEKVRAKERLEQTVIEQTASLKQAIAQMEEFSYSVSHDLRSPLRAIEGYTRVILEDFRTALPDESKELLEKIRRNVHRMQRLIEDVLTLSRVARVDVHLQALPLRPLIQDILEQNPNLQKAKIQLGELSDVLVLAHDILLSQAIFNLLSNAVKFVPPGTQPSIKIWTEPSSSLVRLWIEDNGIGIRPEHQPKLFTMFQRFSQDPRFEGTGIGLAIVRKAVERMGGAVGVQSHGTGGSKFWIELKNGSNTK